MHARLRLAQRLSQSSVSRVRDNSTVHMNSPHFSIVIDHARNTPRPHRMHALTIVSRHHQLFFQRRERATEVEYREAPGPAAAQLLQVQTVLQSCIGL